MKIGFAARYDPRSKQTWSGTAYYTYQAIAKYGEVEIFRFPLPKLLQEWLTTQKSINKRWFGKNTSVEFLRAYARYFSRRLSAELKKRPVDILFVSASSQLLAWLKTDIPVIYMTDATFQQLQGYYPSFSNLAEYNIRQGIALDKKAFQNAAHCMLASDWCRDSAIHDYGIDAGTISVVPCGANLDEVPPFDSSRIEKGDSCRLLFLGVEWERKGGALALEAFEQLKKEGIQASLHIIGCTPPESFHLTEGITVIPFLDKNKKEDLEKLYGIFRQTDFLLLPTRAECAGIVFCEAAAFGIPSISTDTGGVSTYVRNGINGFTLPPEAGGMAYAQRIKDIFNDTAQYVTLRQSARNYYDSTLCWEAWGRSFHEIARRLIGIKKGS